MGTTYGTLLFSKLLGGKVRGVGVQILEGTKIPINSDLCVHDVEKVSMACRACDHFLWKSLKQVLVVDGKNLKVGGFNYPWGDMCEKAPCSHSKNSQDEVSYCAYCILKVISRMV